MASAIDSRLSQTIKSSLIRVELQQTTLMGKFSTVSKRLQLKHKWLWSLKEGDVQATNDGYIFYALVEYIYGEANICFSKK